MADRDGQRARDTAKTFAIPTSYDDADQMMAREALDFVDIVTTPDSHVALVRSSLQHGLHTICQKPLTPDFDQAKTLVAEVGHMDASLTVHENFRWRPAMRVAKSQIAALGKPFFCRISLRSGHDVLANQPFLARQSRFIMLDLGIHLVDLSRFFLGEFDRVSAVTQQINPTIAGEDSATILLRGVDATACVVDMSYASTPAREPFPEVRLEIEGTGGSLDVIPGKGVFRTLSADMPQRCNVPDPEWSLPEAKIASAAVYGFQRNWIDCLRDEIEPETSARRNLRSLYMIAAAYDAARDGHTVHLDENQ